MTKEQIYIELGYTGVYTKEVKRRFRMLTKKYHPDVYQGDDSIMKLLNQVREEIENGCVESIFYQKKKEPTPNTKEETSVEENFFYGVTIEQLQRKIEELKKIQVGTLSKIQKLNREINLLYQEFIARMQKYEESKVHIEELQKQKENRFPFVLVGTISSILLFAIGSLFYFSIFWIFLILVALGIFLYYTYHLYQKISFLNREVSRGYANKNSYFNEALTAKEKVDFKEMERIKEDATYRRMADDIQLYYYEMSKKQGRQSKEKQNNYQKGYRSM